MPTHMGHPGPWFRVQQRLSPDDGPVTTILFDMDNTLFDLVEAKLAACREVVAAVGKGDRDELFRYFREGQWGFEDWRNIRDYLCDHSRYSDERYETCCRIYDTVKLDGIVPYPNVPETLETLRDRGFRLGVITDAFARDAERRLAKADLRSRFDLVATCDRTGRKKPDAEPFLFALRALRAFPGETVLVGDSPHRDMEPAKRLGMRTVYARYGDRFSVTRTATHADFVIDDIGELPALLPRTAGL